MTLVDPRSGLFRPNLSTKAVRVAGGVLATQTDVPQDHDPYRVNLGQFDAVVDFRSVQRNVYEQDKIGATIDQCQARTRPTISHFRSSGLRSNISASISHKFLTDSKQRATKGKDLSLRSTMDISHTPLSPEQYRTRAKDCSFLSKNDYSCASRDEASSTDNNSDDGSCSESEGNHNFSWFEGPAAESDDAFVDKPAGVDHHVHSSGWFQDPFLTERASRSPHLSALEEHTDCFSDARTKNRTMASWEKLINHDKMQMRSLRRISDKVEFSQRKIPGAKKKWYSAISCEASHRTADLTSKMSQWKPSKTLDIITERNKKKTYTSQRDAARACRKEIDKLKKGDNTSSTQQTKILDLYMEHLVFGSARTFRHPPKILLLHGPTGVGKTATRDCLLEMARICGTCVLKMSFNAISVADVGGETTCGCIGVDGKKHMEEVGTSSKDVLQRLEDAGFNKESIITVEDFEASAPWHLARLHRLCQMKNGNDEPFGGCLVVLIGDLGQLSPIKAGLNLSQAVMDANLDGDLKPRSPASISALSPSNEVPAPADPHNRENAGNTDVRVSTETGVIGIDMGTVSPTIADALHEGDRYDSHMFAGKRRSLESAGTGSNKKSHADPTLLPGRGRDDSRFRSDHHHAFGAGVMTKARWYELTEQQRSIDPIHTRVVTKTYRMEPINFYRDLKSNGYKLFSEADAMSEVWIRAPVIVACNRERYSLSLQRAVDLARFLGQPVIRWMSHYDRFRWNNKPVNDEDELDALSDPCFYELFVEGSDGYLKDSYMRHLRLVNGTRIKYHSLVFEDQYKDIVKERLQRAEPGKVVTFLFAPTAVVVEVIMPEQTEKEVLDALRSFSVSSHGRPEERPILIPIYPFAGKWSNRPVPVYGGLGYEPSSVYLGTVFPLEPAFAITIHKAVGRTLDRVILAISHNSAPGCSIEYRQLHTVLSKVKEREHIRFLLKGKDESSQWQSLAYLESLKPDPSVGYYLAGFRPYNKDDPNGEDYWRDNSWSASRANDWYRQNML